MKIKKYLLAMMRFVPALALVPLALDWRSSLLAAVRPMALAGLVVLSLALIFAEGWALRSSRPGHRLLTVLNALGLSMAVLALTCTLVLEARFHWERYQVLRADPRELEGLGRHVIVGYRDIEEVRELVRLRAVAGVFITTRNVRGKSLEQVRQEIQSVQSIRETQGLPRLWVATDQEGGMVSRLSPPLPELPPISEMVERSADRAQLEQAVRKFATTQGRGLADLGVNLNLAPVVDLNHNIRNTGDVYTLIYRRAIAHDPGVVTQVAGWYCAALEETGVSCTLKHFPGLGRVSGDTHFVAARLDTPVAELTGTDWMPFLELMRHSGVFTMLGHVRLTALDPDLPVSMSPAVVGGLLRTKWKYDGVLITDDFCMSAVYRSSFGIGNGSVQALNAGVDLILVSWDESQYYRVMHALLTAAGQGRLDVKALARSDCRLKQAVKVPGGQ